MSGSRNLSPDDVPSVRVGSGKSERSAQLLEFLWGKTNELNAQAAILNQHRHDIYQQLKTLEELIQFVQTAEME